MHVPAAVLLCASTALAYQVLSPGGSQGWTTAGPNFLTWTRVATDPLNFTAVLSNANRTALPVNNLILGAYVDGTIDNVECAPPSGGWPTGSGFRVNLAQDDEHPDSLLAQSDEFDITGTSSSASAGTGATATSSGSTSVGSSATTATGTASGTTGSATAATSTSTSAALVGTDTNGLFAVLAALTAVFATAF